MKTFTLSVQDAENSFTRTDVVSFIGADSSGQFGVLAGGEPLLVSLRFGLARFRPMDNVWHFLALPSGVLQYDGQTLLITTTHFLVSTDRDAMSAALTQEIATAEANVVTARKTITQIEHALMKKLWDMGRQQPGMGFPE